MHDTVIPRVTRGEKLGNSANCE